MAEGGGGREAPALSLFSGQGACSQQCPKDAQDILEALGVWVGVRPGWGRPQSHRNLRFSNSRVLLGGTLDAGAENLQQSDHRVRGVGMKD